MLLGDSTQPRNITSDCASGKVERSGYNSIQQVMFCGRWFAVFFVNGTGLLKAEIEVAKSPQSISQERVC